MENDPKCKEFWGEVECFLECEGIVVDLLIFFQNQRVCVKTLQVLIIIDIYEVKNVFLKFQNYDINVVNYSQKRLLSAMDRCYTSLTDEEKGRNSFGKCLKYTYDKSLNFIYPTTYPEIFEDVKACKALKEEIDRTKFHLDVSLLKKGLMEGTQLDVYFPGFPTMRHLEHKSYLKKAGVKVFQYNSRSENMIVKVMASGKEVRLHNVFITLI